MPDKTKQVRSNALPNSPRYVEGGQGKGDILRTDLPNQNTQIDNSWGTDQLEAIPLDSPANLQYAGPGSRVKYYRPTGKSSIVGRPGLDDGDTDRGLEQHALRTINPSGQKR